MRLKKIIKKLLPPIIADMCKKKTKMEEFPNYENALRECGHCGYENNDISKVVVDKNIQLKNYLAESNITIPVHHLRFLAYLPTFIQKKINIIDFGGGGGNHYFLFQKFLGDGFNINWHVVETKAMVSSAMQAGLQDDSLKFYTSIKDAVKDMKNIDLVFTSGTLQYCDKPTYYLKELIDINPTHLVITRTAFNQEPKKVVALQRSKLSDNGPTISDVEHNKVCNKICPYLVTFEPLEEIKNLLSTSFNIMIQVNEESEGYETTKQKFNMYGFVCTKQVDKHN